MTTVAAVADRVRLEIGDERTSFQSQSHADGETRRFEVPYAPLSDVEFRLLSITEGQPIQVLVRDTDYVLDAAEGTFTFPQPPAEGTELVAQGTAFKYFNEHDMELFVSTAALQHLNNRAGVTLATLPPVEEYLVALLAAIEALYALLNDAAFDIDVSTPEGVGIPRSQRFRQLQEMIELRKGQYAEMAGALNVGLNRIEQFSLRRVSRTTGRLVPVYVPQEIEDRQPAQRVFLPIDSHGGVPINDPTPVLDLTMYEYGYFEEAITGLGDLTGWKIDARIRRYEDGSSRREFVVEVDDLVAGNIRIGLTPRQTALLPSNLFWDLRLTNRNTSEVRTLRKGKVYVIQQVGVDESHSNIGNY